MASRYVSLVLDRPRDVCCGVDESMDGETIIQYGYVAHDLFYWELIYMTEQYTACSMTAIIIFTV